MDESTAPTLNIRLLGEFSLDHAGAPVTGVNTPRLQSLLAYLLLHRDAPQSRAHLAFQFWPDSTEAQARTNLRTLLHRLRRALPGDTPYLDVDAQTVQWHPDAPASVDVIAFEDALVEAEEARDDQVARNALEKAASLYGGDLLPSCYDDWILPHRERLRQARLRALERLTRLLEDRREYDTAIAHAQRILRLDPLHEAATRRLMHLHSLKGDRTGALRAYHTCATALQRELGVQPSPATQRAYEQVLNVEAQPAPAPSLASGLTLLVGREEEWAHLQAAWRGITRGPRLVLILGEAGIGKTRLVEELLHWASQQGVDHAYARSYAAEGELAYAPVTTLLQARPLPALDDVWLSEVARLLPQVLAQRPDLPPPQPMTESWQRQRLFQALARAVLGGGSRRGPLLLVLDDLQWCDRESLEWLHYLLRFDPRAPLLVVGTCRPEELHEDCPLTSALPALHRDVRLRELGLGPLNEAETATLAAGVSRQALDPAAAAHLHHETEGNPLFVVESLRAGLPARQELPDVAGLPPRVQAVLTTRLAQLSAPARQLAEIAATIGRQFAVPLLQQASDASEDSLARGLDELWRRRIVRERGLDAYDFTHDKLREAAYTTLSPARRRLLHHRVAQALESVHALDLDPVSRQVAAHYHRAGLPAQAIPHYLRAGQVASTIYAHQEAIASFEHGLALLEEGTWDASQNAWRSQMAAQGHEGLGDVLTQNQPGAGRAAYRNALQEIPQEDLLARARLHRKIARTWWPEGEHEKAVQSVHRALKILGAEPSTPDADWWNEWGNVQSLRSLVCYYSARLQELDDTIKEMQRGLEHHTTPMQQFFLAQAIGAARLRRDRYVVSDEDVAQLVLWLNTIQKTGDADTYTRLVFFLGWGLLLHGDLDGAEKHLQEALALAERTRHLVHQTWVLTQLSILYRRRGQADATRESALRCLHVAMSGQLLENAAVARGNLAWLAWRQGDLTEAEEQGRNALELWQKSPFVYAFHWTARFPLLAMALEKGALAKALDHARALLHPQQQRLPEPLEAALEAAIQAGDDGSPESARQHLEHVLLVAKETGYL